MSGNSKRAREEVYITKKGFHAYLLCPEDEKNYVCVSHDLEEADIEYIEDNTEELFEEYGFPVSAETFHAFCAGEMDEIGKEAIKFMNRWQPQLNERYGMTEEDQPFKDIEDVGIPGKYQNRYYNRFEAEIESLGDETGATLLPYALWEWMSLKLHVDLQEQYKVRDNPNVNDGMNTVVANIAETIGTLKETMEELREHIEAFWEEALGRDVSFGDKNEEDEDYNGDSGSNHDIEDISHETGSGEDDSDSDSESDSDSDSDSESDSDSDSELDSESKKEWDNSDEEE